jgi:hypothetical protein
VQPSRDPRETIASPTVAKRDSDREHVRPLPPWHAIEVAHEFREEIVGIQLLDERVQEPT